jgi:hypothetical protein
MEQRSRWGSIAIVADGGGKFDYRISKNVGPQSLSNVSDTLLSHFLIYQSAYSNDLSHFDGPIERWFGPHITFVNTSSQHAGFSIEIVTPPEPIKHRSAAFFNDTSQFDECIYAASLGIVDFCVSQYTITTERATLVDWQVTSEQNIRLITQIQGIVVVTDWSSLLEKIGTSYDIITLPFETNTWYFLIFFVIPALGIMFILHEYDQTGSEYQMGETEKEENEDGTIDVTYREIPFWEHLGVCLYKSFLGVLQSEYEGRIVSNGGFIHLIGVSFFILTIIAVCKSSH